MVYENPSLVPYEAAINVVSNVLNKNGGKCNDGTSQATSTGAYEVDE